jgi:hypothetical protein
VQQALHEMAKRTAVVGGIPHTAMISASFTAREFLAPDATFSPRVCWAASVGLGVGIDEGTGDAPFTHASFSSVARPHRSALPLIGRRSGGANGH